MSHEVETIAWSGQRPWHGLGVEVPALLSPREMQLAAHLDWTVSTVPLKLMIDDTVQTLKTHALVRSSDNAVLDILPSDSWKPVQNDQAFDFFDEFIHFNRMSMEVAGSLFGGRIVFVLAKMRRSFRISASRSDETEAYLLFTNPHKYGRSVDIRLTPVRVVCANTLALSLSKETRNAVKFNHRRSFNVAAARDAFLDAIGVFEEYEEQAQFLASKRYKTRNLRAYFNDCFPRTPNIHTQRPDLSEPSANAQHALEVIETQPGASYAAGTWWSALNAVTYMTDHELGNSRVTRLQSAWYGKGERRKRDAFRLAVKYAKAA